MDSIHDAERCRDELVKIAFGVWDYVRDHGGMPPEDVENWALDWLGFLPKKRKSRRYLGDHILTQNDIRAEGRFDDLVAYGGWTMDDHFPQGFHHPKAGTTFHPAPSPFGIPYGSLYSRNIENLFCAGRCHSATHAAMSATRVMGTTSLMGQAVGAAAAIAARDGLTPRGVYEQRFAELQESLLDDDCYLPWHIRSVPELTCGARLVAEHGDPEPLRNGLDRPIREADNGWTRPLGTTVEVAFDRVVPVTEARFIFDSDLNRVDTSRGHQARNMRHYYALDAEPWCVPDTLVRRFRIDALSADGEEVELASQTATATLRVAPSATKTVEWRMTFGGVSRGTGSTPRGISPPTGPA